MLNPIAHALATMLAPKKSAAYQVLVSSNAEGKPTTEGENFDTLAASQLYQKLASVYAGVYAIATAVASVPIRVFSGEDELPDHPLAAMLGPLPGEPGLPNPIDTSYDIIELTTAFLELAGDAYLLLEGGDIDRGGAPATITPLRPHRVRPIPDKLMKISGYHYEVDGRPLRFTRDQVLHLQYFSPVHDYLGQGSVEPATMAAIVDLWAVAFNKGFFKRGATLSGVLESDDELDSVLLRRLVEEFRQEHSGSGKAWDVKGLSHSLKFKTVQPSHQDMLFENLRKMNREEILMALGVPPVMVTLLDGATYANAQEQKRQFWELTILPKLRKLQARLNKDLAPRWGAGISVKFDTSDVAALQPDRQAIVAAGVAAVQYGIVTRNEVRKWLSTGELPVLDDLETGDIPLLPFTAAADSSVLDDTEPEPAPAPPPPAPEPEPEDEAGKAISKLLAEAHTHHRNLRRKATWRAFDKNSRAFGRVFARAARAMFSEQLKLILDNLDEVLARRLAKGVAEVELLLEATLVDNRKRFTAIYAEAMKVAGDKAISDLGVAGLDFNITSAEVLRFIEKEGAELVTETLQVTKDRLKATLAEGVADGENALQLSDRVRHTMGDEASRSRANTIGRTESIKSFNAGAVEAYKQTGLVERKRWLATIDGDVRETHADADNQVVGINESFLVGEAQLQYPGDPGGGFPEETINCRCTVEPILKGEEDDVDLSLSSRERATT